MRSATLSAEAVSQITEIPSLCRLVSERHTAHHCTLIGNEVEPAFRLLRLQAISCHGRHARHVAICAFVLSYRGPFVILCNAEAFRVFAYGQVAGICRILHCCTPRARGVKRQGLPPLAAALPSVISAFQHLSASTAC